MADVREKIRKKTKITHYGTSSWQDTVCLIHVRRACINDEVWQVLLNMFCLIVGTMWGLIWNCCELFVCATDRIIQIKDYNLIDRVQETLQKGWDSIESLPQHYSPSEECTLSACRPASAADPEDRSTGVGLEVGLCLAARLIACACLERLPGTWHLRSGCWILEIDRPTPDTALQKANLPQHYQTSGQRSDN